MTMCNITYSCACTHTQFRMSHYSQNILKIEYQYIINNIAVKNYFDSDSFMNKITWEIQYTFVCVCMYVCTYVCAI